MSSNEPICRACQRAIRQFNEAVNAWITKIESTTPALILGTIAASASYHVTTAVVAEASAIYVVWRQDVEVLLLVLVDSDIAQVYATGPSAAALAAVLAELEGGEAECFAQAS